MFPRWWLYDHQWAERVTLCSWLTIINWNEAPQTGTTKRTIELFHLKSKSHHSYYWTKQKSRYWRHNILLDGLTRVSWSSHSEQQQNWLARWESNARIIIRMEEHGGKPGLELRKALGPLGIETLTTMGKRPCVGCWTMLWKISFQNSEIMEEIQNAEASHNPNREVYWGRWFGKGIYWQEKLTEPEWTHPSKDKTWTKIMHGNSTRTLTSRARTWRTMKLRPRRRQQRSEESERRKRKTARTSRFFPQ